MEKSIDELRVQLKSLGYLTHGIERWFALDPWSSRMFWAELLAITAKAAVIAAPFAALPLTAVMLLRNRPPAYDALLLLLVYLLGAFVGIAAVILATAALLKLRPIAIIKRPGSLIWISLLQSSIVVAAILVWWIAFPIPPRLVEIVAMIGLLLLFLPIGTLAFSAALLSFSIYETQQIPSIHRRSRTVPLTVAGATLLLLLVLFVPGARPEMRAGEPPQVVVAPTEVRLIFFAVDGLTHEVFAARGGSRELLPHITKLEQAPQGSAPETWASIGTGTTAVAHGVRSVEAVRFAGSERLLQAVSRFDVMLTEVAEAVRLTRQQPLPPTARERHYVWEVLGARGIGSLAVNWWAISNVREPGLRTVSQESVYAAAARTPNPSPLDLALSIDRVALEVGQQSLGDSSLKFATVYLPALEIVLNRLEVPTSVALAASVRALDSIDAAVAEARRSQWEVLLVGIPGQGQDGDGFIASTIPLAGSGTSWSIAPTLLDLFGFPTTNEMPGPSLLPDSQQQRIRTYGTRRVEQKTRVDEEYYEKLRSLGYVR